MARQLTIDQLAGMVQRGFEGTVTKDEFNSYREETRASFSSLTQILKSVVDMLDLMRADTRDIKVTLGGLVRTVTVLEESVQALDKRVTRLEEKARP